MTSKNNEWETPDEIFKTINTYVDFRIDVCATKENAKLKKYWTKENDGLKQSWDGLVCWCNPPYDNITPWIEKALTAELCAVLVPTRTDQQWWHLAVRHCAYIDFFIGRVHFLNTQKTEQKSPNEKHALLWFFCDNTKPAICRSRSARNGILI
jgi:phage N-6-adenine-methyltransferase